MTLDGELYATEASFQWHSTEKHLSEVILYTCPVGQCWVSCQRCYDMKVQFLRIHNAKKEFVESIPSKGQTSLPSQTQSISTRNLGLSSAGPANLILLPCCWMLFLFRWIQSQSQGPLHLCLRPLFSPWPLDLLPHQIPCLGMLGLCISQSVCSLTEFQFMNCY